MLRLRIAARTSLSLLLHLYAFAVLGLQLASWRNHGSFWPIALLVMFSHWWMLPALFLFPIALLARWRANALSLGLVAFCFVWIYGAFLLPAPAEPASRPDRLTVATVNAGGYRGTPEEIANVVLGTGADLIALQEIVDPFVDELRKRTLERYPYQVYRGGLGLALMAVYPIQDAELVDVDNDPGRMQLVGNVQVGGRTVRVVAAHNYPPVSVPLLYGLRYQAHPKSASMAEALGRLTLSTGEPAILLGDLNFPMRSSGYLALERLGLGDAYRSAGRGWSLGATWPEGVERLGIRLQPFIRLDYVWHSEHWTALDAYVGQPFASDHRPMIATLAW
jgi:vancomycin resistance protein VanJ